MDDLRALASGDMVLVLVTPTVCRKSAARGCLGVPFESASMPQFKMDGMAATRGRRRACTVCSSHTGVFGGRVVTSVSHTAANDCWR